MDFEMPVMNGPSATARLRELGCACLIVGVTGNVLPTDVNIFRDHGADAVLTKPLVLETLTALLMAGRTTGAVACAPSRAKPHAIVNNSTPSKVYPMEIV
jgi:CheY-like chemotaxis protein